MKLKWFEVEGYKNIRSTLRLEELGPVNVLHGDNNVGKSNLLEAIGLFFFLLRTIGDDVRGGPSVAERFDKPTDTVQEANEVVRTSRYFADQGFPPEAIFNILDPQPIKIVAGLVTQHSKATSKEAQRVEELLVLGFRLERRNNTLVLAITRLGPTDEPGLLEELKREPTALAENKKIREVFESIGSRQRNRDQAQFLLVRADRTALSDSPNIGSEQTALTGREPLSRDLGLALYDAEKSADQKQKQRYRTFLTSLETFRTLVGGSDWRMSFDRNADRAEANLVVGTNWLPLRLMGSGVQQIVNLAARVLMADVDVVALEEPELNLRYDIQIHLRDVLARLAGEGVLEQIFLTSHSPAFELSPCFYAILPSAAGPRVERRARETARQFTSPDVDMPPDGTSAPLSYVTTEGLVRVPPDVRTALKLDNGGGVVFAAGKDGYFRMLTDDQFCDLIEPWGSSS